jgi:hypothetical protein
LDSGIGSLESIPGLVKHLQIRAQATLENIVYSDSCLKKKIPFFWAVLCAFGFKVCKNANMTQKIIFSDYFDMGIKNAEFDADFESVKKVVKKCLRKKLFA